LRRLPGFGGNPFSRHAQEASPTLNGSAAW
jgi:hypothetical protein